MTSFRFTFSNKNFVKSPTQKLNYLFYLNFYSQSIIYLSTSKCLPNLIQPIMHYFNFYNKSSYGPDNIIVTPFLPSFVSMNINVLSFPATSYLSGFGLGKLRKKIFSQLPVTYVSFYI